VSAEKPKSQKGPKSTESKLIAWIRFDHVVMLHISTVSESTGESIRVADIRRVYFVPPNSCEIETADGRRISTGFLSYPEVCDFLKHAI
jgi:hypothetical protein